MRITRDNQPLNLIVYDKFVLKMLGFSEWVEVHALASKVRSKSNDLLLKNLKANFQWVKTQVAKLSIPLPPQLTVFELLIGKHNSRWDAKEPDSIKGVVGKDGMGYDELIYKIESRPDFIQAREILEKNLDGMD
ncbi:hypothetical protein Tco_0755077 [Tanacetum coccineum]